MHYNQIDAQIKPNYVGKGTTVTHLLERAQYDPGLRSVLVERGLSAMTTEDAKQHLGRAMDGVLRYSAGTVCDHVAKVLEIGAASMINERPH